MSNQTFRVVVECDGLDKKQLREVLCKVLSIPTSQYTDCFGWQFLVFPQEGQLDDYESTLEKEGA